MLKAEVYKKMKLDLKLKIDLDFNVKNSTSESCNSIWYYFYDIHNHITQKWLKILLK